MADPTNEELAERLEDMAGATPRRDAFSKTDTETCRLAAARLRQPLPSGDGWTKIEDDEPNHDTFVFVAFDRGYGNRDVTHGYWPEIRYDHPDGGARGTITHWQYAEPCYPALPQEDDALLDEPGLAFDADFVLGGIRSQLTASREREKKMAEALGGMPCLLDLINTTVAQCAVTRPDCSACRALAAHREAGE